MTTLLLLVLLPFLAVPAIVAAGGLSRRAAVLVAGATMLGGLALLLAQAPALFAGQTILFLLDWLPDWGVSFNLRLDGLGFLFALLIYGIGALIVLYAAYYMPEDDRLGRFLGTLMAFAGGMLGVVLAENILLMLLFWEVTSLTSFLLIAYKYRYAESRLAARLALFVTGGGGLALLAGLLLVGHMAGSFELSVILDRGDLVRAHRLYEPALVLVLLGAFTKSAQFPFHIWLPQAMAAPTPVSAYLHSATMVKAGVFLLAGWLAAQVLPGRATPFYMEIPPMRLPSLSNVLLKTLARLQWYFLEVLPLFLIASVLIWVGQLTGLFDLVLRVLTPLTRALSLPAEASVAFLFGFFRRDYGAAGLYDLHEKGMLTGNDMLITAVVLTLFVPCVAQFLVTIKERGWKTALGMFAIAMTVAFGAGFALSRVLSVLGVQVG